jgi:hypothetical protein
MSDLTKKELIAKIYDLSNENINLFVNEDYFLSLSEERLKDIIYELEKLKNENS